MSHYLLSSPTNFLIVRPMESHNPTQFYDFFSETYFCFLLEWSALTWDHKQHFWSKLACCINLGNHSLNYTTCPVSLQQQLSLPLPCNGTTVHFQITSK